MGEVGDIVAQRDGYRRVSEEAMKLMTDEQLLALAERLDELDGTVRLPVAASEVLG